jgi:hypothetical protein
VNQATEVVSRIEELGGYLALDVDGSIRYGVPKDSREAHELLARLREHRERVAEFLRQRAHESGEHWPPESLDAERRFGQPHARLFPFIGRKVRTPGGPGVLLQVFAELVTVALDSELSKCAVFVPGEIEPVRWELR